MLRRQLYCWHRRVGGFDASLQHPGDLELQLAEMKDFRNRTHQSVPSAEHLSADD